MCELHLSVDVNIVVFEMRKLSYTGLIRQTIDNYLTLRNEDSLTTSVGHLPI